MSALKIVYKTSVEVGSTKYLKFERFDLTFNSEVELEGSDVALGPTVESKFKKAIDSQIKIQKKALESWLKERSEYLESIENDFQELSRIGPPNPSNHAKLKSLSERVKRNIERGTTDIDLLTAELKTIVKGWVENLQQQVSVAEIIALKEARVQRFADKKWKTRAIETGKIVLVATAAALAVAAAVATFPVSITVLGIAAFVLGLTGALVALSRFKKQGELLLANFDAEKRVMLKVQEDILTLQSLLAKTAQQGAQYSKHVAELSNFIQVNADRISDLKRQKQELVAIVNGLLTESTKYVSAVSGTNLENWKTEAKKTDKRISEAISALSNVSSAIAEEERINRLAADLLKQLEDLGVSVAEFRNVAPSPNLLQTTKGYVTSREGALTLLENSSTVLGQLLDS